MCRAAEAGDADALAAIAWAEVSTGLDQRSVDMAIASARRTARPKHHLARGDELRAVGHGQRLVLALWQLIYRSCRKHARGTSCRIEGRRAEAEKSGVPQIEGCRCCRDAT